LGIRGGFEEKSGVATLVSLNPDALKGFGEARDDRSECPWDRSPALSAIAREIGASGFREAGPNPRW
jgi:hypothetical protein